MRPERDSLNTQRPPRDPDLDREISIAASLVTFPLITFLAGLLAGSGEPLAGVLIIAGGLALVWLSRWTR